MVQFCIKKHFLKNNIVGSCGVLINMSSIYSTEKVIVKMNMIAT